MLSEVRAESAVSLETIQTPVLPIAARPWQATHAVDRLHDHAGIGPLGHGGCARGRLSSRSHALHGRARPWRVSDGGLPGRGVHPHCARASVAALIGSARVRCAASRGPKRTTRDAARSGWASDSTQRLSRSPSTALRLTRVRRINYDHRAWSGAAQGSVAGACARSTGARPRNGHRFGPWSPESTLLQCGARRPMRHPAAAGVKVIHRLIDTGAWVLLSRRKIA